MLEKKKKGSWWSIPSHEGKGFHYPWGISTLHCDDGQGPLKYRWDVFSLCHLHHTRNSVKVCGTNEWMPKQCILGRSRSWRQSSEYKQKVSGPLSLSSLSHLPFLFKENPNGSVSLTHTVSNWLQVRHRPSGSSDKVSVDEETRSVSCLIPQAASPELA